MLTDSGDSFVAGDVLLEIETDKAQMDVEAQDDGILAKIIVCSTAQHNDKCRLTATATRRCEIRPSWHTDSSYS